MSSEARWVTVVHFLFVAAGALGGLFINIFLWKQSNDFLVIIKYNLFSYAFTLAAFLLIRHVLKRLHLGLLMQAGLFILLLEYVFLLVFHENVFGIVWLLGLLNGLGGGLYWAGHNIFEYLWVIRSKRIFHSGMSLRDRVSSPPSRLTMQFSVLAAARLGLGVPGCAPRAVRPGLGSPEPSELYLGFGRDCFGTLFAAG